MQYKNRKKYCRVPIIFQIIQVKRGIDFVSQVDIGYQLCLIDKLCLFSKALTGRMPKTGWETQK